MSKQTFSIDSMSERKGVAKYTPAAVYFVISEILRIPSMRVEVYYRPATE